MTNGIRKDFSSTKLLKRKKGLTLSNNTSFAMSLVLLILSNFIFIHNAQAQENVTLKWRYVTSSGFNRMIAVTDDGTIYATNSNQILYAISPEGQLKWQVKSSEYDMSAPSVDANGTIYYSTFFPGALCSVSSEGESLKCLSTSEAGAPAAIDNQQNIYWATMLGGISSYAPNNSFRWRTSLDGWGDVGATISDDGNLYAIAYNANDNGDESIVYSISKTGEINWSSHFNYRIVDRPVIDENGHLYFAGNKGSIRQGTLISVDADGKTRWIKPLFDEVRFSPTIDTSGRIIISTDNKVRAYSASGSTIWSTNTSGIENTAPTIASDGTIYVGSSTGILYAIKPNGLIKFTYSAEGKIRAAPTIDDNGTLYFGTNEGFIYALNTDSGPLANTPCPKRFCDLNNTSRSTSVVDSDGDGLSDRAELELGTDPNDADTDNDGFSDFDDKFPTNPDEWNDNDLDGIGDNADNDDDNDGVQDNEDAFPLDPDETTDTDSDGIGNNADNDDDNDGVPDSEDAAPLDPEITEVEVNSITLPNTSGSIVSVDQNDHLYVTVAGDENGDFVNKYTLLGTLLSSVQLNGSGLSTPAISGDGNYYVTSTSPGGLYSISPQGTINWHFASGESGLTPTIGTDGTLYFGTHGSDGKLMFYAINPDGSEKWSRALELELPTSAAIAKDGTIYVLTSSSDRPEDLLKSNIQLNGITPEGGFEWGWSLHIFGYSLSNPAVDKDGNVYLTTSNGWVMAFSPDIKSLWTQDFDIPFETSPAIGNDGTTYVASGSRFNNDAGKVIAISNDGLVLWTYEHENGFLSSPTLTNDLKIHLIDKNGTLIVLNTNGTLSSAVPLDAKVDASVSLTSDGTLIIPASDSRILTLSTGTGAIANSPWPQKHNNAFSNSNVDADGDSITNLEESEQGTNPLKRDSDDDGFEDNIEIALGRDPLVATFATQDFDANGYPDILYRSNTNFAWSSKQLSGTQTDIAAFTLPFSRARSWQFKDTGDLNGDGYYDVLIQNANSNAIYTYHLKGESIINRGYLALESAENDTLLAVADFNGDGKDDLIMRNSETKAWSLQLLEGKSSIEKVALPFTQASSWLFMDTPDLDGNGTADILIRNTNSNAWYAYIMEGATLKKRSSLPLPRDPELQFKGTGDFNKDGKIDILVLDNTTQKYVVYFMNSLRVENNQPLPIPVNTDGEIFVKDFNSDGFADVLSKSNDAESIFFLENGQLINQWELESDSNLVIMGAH